MNIQCGNFFEKHVEKLVLAIVGIVCLWLLLSGVLWSPNKVKYGNDYFGAAVIDEHIKTDAQRLESKLTAKPKARGKYYSKKGAFISLLTGQVNKEAFDMALIKSLCPEAAKYMVVNLATKTEPILPAFVPFETTDDRQYSIPHVGEVADVSAEHFRVAAYVPLEQIDSEHRYTEDTSEVNDIDFVTVSATFDMAELRDSFRESFMGVDVNELWRDPCLAKPVFSAVELEREELLPDGSWSGWSVVPRSRVDARKEMFTIIEDASKLGPGGVAVRKLRFENQKVMIDLLQPETYRIASSDEQWFPPDLHRRYVEYQKQQDKLERRKAAEAEKTAREDERLGDSRYPSRGRVGTAGYTSGSETGAGSYSSGRQGPMGYNRGRLGMRAGAGRLDSGRNEEGFGRPIRRGRRPVRTSGMSTRKNKNKNKNKNLLNDLYDELEKIQLTDKTDVSKMREPLVFWAHDDTVEPGKTYRYRIRLGVFNPIAGTEKVKDEYASLKNSVILWSSFSKTTDELAIPRRLYFFAKGIQEAARKVTVKIAKYMKGYWYSKSFQVEPGEVIGSVVDEEAERQKETDNNTGTDSDSGSDFELPATIDYRTGAVLVDIGVVSSWLAGGRYSEILYSYDGIEIEHMSVRYSDWPSGVKTIFRDIELAEKKTRKAYQSFAATKSKHKRYIPALGEEAPEGRDTDRGANEAAQWEKMMGGG